MDYPLFAITTQPPQTGRAALEIPEIERKRADLSDLKQCWIMADEYIYDIVKRSRYFEPGQDALGLPQIPHGEDRKTVAGTRGRSGRVNSLN
ncbi:hypothetical protein ABIE40_005862 [Rhizobium sp. OAE497]